jgi:hypothetical protein
VSSSLARPSVSIEWDEQVLRFRDSSNQVERPWSGFVAQGGWISRASFPDLAGHLFCFSGEEGTDVLRLPWDCSSRQLNLLTSAIRQRGREHPPTTLWRCPGRSGAALYACESDWSGRVRSPLRHFSLGGAPALDLADDFLCDPVSVIRSAFPEPLVLPSSLDAGSSVLTVEREGAVRAWVLGTRREPHLADPRTTVVLETDDAGKSWRELPMRLAWSERWMPRAWFNWPPDLWLDAVRSEKDGLAVYFEDPWIDWESGCRWRAVFDGKAWRMQKRDRGRWPPP